MDVRGLLIAAAGAALLAGCASGGSGHAGKGSGPSSSSGTAPVATAVRTFQPYSAGGRLKARVTGHVSGRCWESSLVAPAADTYRCLAANRILDPCFPPPGSGTKGPITLACLADPWSKAVELQVRRLPKSQPLTARPWTIVLASGQRCVAASGTAPFVHGVGLDYSCSGRVAAALRDVGSRHVVALVGHVGGSTLRRTFVRAIWRG